MIGNYFRIALRNLRRNKGFTITNVLGLTIGITCTIMILLWVSDELNFDKFHTNYPTIYKLMANRTFDNRIMTDENMVLPLAQNMQKEIPQIKNAVVTTHQQPSILTYGETKLKKQGYTVSEHFFDMFTWRFVQGNTATALPDPYSLVLTQSAAKSLFGNEEAVNKIVRVDNTYDAKVTAVVADPPGNSTFQFDYIKLFNYSGDFEKNAMANWQNSSWNVFFQTQPGASISSIEKSINNIKYQHDPGDKKISTYFSFPMSKWRLYSDFKEGKNTGGMIEYIRLFIIIAIIILLIACINFMNLSTARSEKRAKEVGVRKTLGSGRKQLMLQFFFESVILAFFSFVLAVIAVYLLLPSYNSLLEKQLVLQLTSPLFLLVSLGIILFTGVVAGSYPALYLSSFNPVKVLKGTFLPGNSAALPRRILVVAQFVISIMLISATIIVYQQIQHIKNRAIGYNPNNLILIPTSPDTQKNFDVIRNELLRTGYVSSVSRSLSPITEVWWKQPSPDWTGKPANSSMIFSGLTTDIDFSKTIGTKMLQGTDFTGMPSDSSAVILNKAAVDAMGLKNPLGTQLRTNRTFTVIGVMDNVIMESPFKQVDPLMVYYDVNSANYINLRLNNQAALPKALSTVENIFKKYNPQVPFEYQFADKEFGKKFITENLISRLTNIFAGLAIFICCIGLAGLVSFTVEKRFREIGVRKVLGASVQQVLLLISREFLKLVIIAFVVAVPAAWWLMSNWLSKYDFHIEITIWVFLATGIIALLLTLLVVTLNTAKAALANPVKSLRTE